MPESTDAPPRSAVPCINAGRAPPLLLDTNVVLDLWLFDDARVSDLASALKLEPLCVLGSGRLRDELAEVLRRARLATGAGAALRRRLEHRSADDVLAAWDGCMLEVKDAESSLAAPQCRDADDQVFVDLALANAPCVLITRDRDLLRMARRLLESRVAVTTPERWRRAWASLHADRHVHEGIAPGF
jgi:predicted nucleic acid-binding protein